MEIPEPEPEPKEGPEDEPEKVETFDYLTDEKDSRTERERIPAKRAARGGGGQSVGEDQKKQSRTKKVATGKGKEIKK